MDNLTFLTNICFVFSNHLKNHYVYDNLPNGTHVVKCNGSAKK